MPNCREACPLILAYHLPYVIHQDLQQLYARDLRKAFFSDDQVPVTHATFDTKETFVRAVQDLVGQL